MARLFPTIIVVTFAALNAAQAAPVTVADGDSFEIGGQRYRLHDIDAPELNQNCTDDKGRRWQCGRHARAELRRLIGRNEVTCEGTTRDRFGRVVATCKAGGRDLGEAMVRAGLATAYKGRGLGAFTSRYEDAEREARAEKRGIWAGQFASPREWRDEHPRNGTAHQAGDIVPRAVQDWLRRTSQSVRRSVRDWASSWWPQKPETQERLRPAGRP